MSSPTKYYVLPSVSGGVYGPYSTIGEATDEAEKLMTKNGNTTAQILAPVWEAKPGIKWAEVKPNA